MKKMPKVITLCGSSKFIETMAVVAWLLERDEKVITFGLHLLPWWYSVESIPDHLAEHEGCAEQMDELHLRKIEISDEVFVVDVGGYIGESTAREIGHAKTLDIPIRYYSKSRYIDAVNSILRSNLKIAIAKEEIGRADQ